MLSLLYISVNLVIVHFVCPVVGGAACCPLPLELAEGKSVTVSRVNDCGGDFVTS